MSLSFKRDCSEKDDPFFLYGIITINKMVKKLYSNKKIGKKMKLKNSILTFLTLM